MYLCIRQEMKGLYKEQYRTLCELSHTAKNLYNESLYQIRQHFFETGQYLPYVQNYHRLKTSENYRTLNSNMAQQILKEADGAFRSFFALLQKKKQGGYQEKIRIKPLQNARFFEMQYTYEETAEKIPLDQKNARLQSIKDKQETPGTTNRQARLAKRRNRKVRDYMSKAAKKILRFCLEHKIGNLVIGYQNEFQRKSRMGKKNNQNFVHIPYGYFRKKLEYLCERYGIHFVIQEESYTSQASFFEQEEMPVYGEENGQKFSFRGKRVQRGLYRTGDGMLLNADINGALNILRKSNVVCLTALYRRGAVDTPKRIRIA